MKNMFVYGSLKKKCFNHSLISENPRNKLIRKGDISGYKMYLLQSYPCIKSSLSNEDEISVELYSLTDEVFEQIDKMEQRAGYDAVEVEDDIGKKGILHVYNRQVQKENIISSGNWTKNHEKLNIVDNNDRK